MAVFKRYLADDFIKTLNAEYRKGGWWKKVADDRDLAVAIRDNYINVYWRGCSLLKLKLEDGKLRGSTHYKYLLLPKHKRQYVNVEDGVVTMLEPASYFVGKNVFDVAALKRTARVSIATRSLASSHETGEFGTRPVPLRYRSGPQPVPFAAFMRGFRLVAPTTIWSDSPMSMGI